MSSDAIKDVLLQVQRPGRYVGGEPGQVVKDPTQVQVRFALCFPDAYEIGMSHLGLRILYSLLNGHEGIWCERAFAPMPDMEAALRRATRPLTTLESATPLSEMDVLGFSLQHELCFTNVLLMLDLGGVPLRSSDRGESDPLVIAGGPTACHPEPVAPFFDVVAIGDGEDVAPQIALVWAEARRRGASRAEALADLANLPSVYVPALADTHLDEASDRLVVDGGVLAKAARVDVLDDVPFPVDGPVPITEAVFDRAMVEIARGCGGGCRFCQAGMVYRPVRERDPAAILDCLRGQLRRGGFDEASLTSLSTADYSQISALVRCAAETLSQDHVALSVSSLRAHGLDAELTEALASVRTTSLTLAPEAATQRLRDVINKNLSDEEIIRGAQVSVTRSRRRLKLYFMLGLPTETDADVEAIADLAKRIQQAVAGRSKRRLALTVSASTFVPKPHTPLQWAGAIGREEIVAKQAALSRALKPARIEGRFHDARLSVLEAIVSRADRRAADLVESAYRHGARFDGWDEHFDETAWRRAIDEWTVDADALRAPIPLDARLPWDHIDVGPSASYLRREYRRSLKGKATSPCLRLDEPGDLVCHGCGIDCDLDAEKQRLEARARSARSLLSGRVTEASPVPPAAHRYRIVLRKQGQLIWVGHLDTVRLVTRLLRRAGLKLAYSKGFHPKPKMSFAAPLPLGMAGLAEVVDASLVELPNGPAPAELISALRDLAPPGLVVAELRRLDADEPAATKILVGAEIVITSSALPADLKPRIDDVLARETLVVRRPKREPIDLRPSLLCLEPWLDEASRTGDDDGDRAVMARVALGHGPSIRPEDLAAWLQIEHTSWTATRIRLLREPLPTSLS